MRTKVRVVFHYLSAIIIKRGYAFLTSIFLVVACREQSSNDMQTAGGKLVTSDDGSKDNPLGYTVQFGLTAQGNNSTGQDRMVADFCTGTLIHQRVVLTAVHCGVRIGHKILVYAGGKRTSTPLKKF